MLKEFLDSLLLKNICLPDFRQPCNPEAFGKSSWDHIFSSLDGRIGDDILFVPDGLRCDCSPSWAAGADVLFTARGERCNFVHPRRSGNKICSSSASGDQILFIPIVDEIWPHPKTHPKWWVIRFCSTTRGLHEPTFLCWVSPAPTHGYILSIPISRG